MDEVAEEEEAEEEDAAEADPGDDLSRLALCFWMLRTFVCTDLLEGFFVDYF